MVDTDLFPFCGLLIHPMYGFLCFTKVLAQKTQESSCNLLIAILYKIRIKKVFTYF